MTAYLEQTCDYQKLKAFKIFKHGNICYICRLKSKPAIHSLTDYHAWLSNTPDAHYSSKRLIILKLLRNHGLKIRPGAGVRVVGRGRRWTASTWALLCMK